MISPSPLGLSFHLRFSIKETQNKWTVHKLRPRFYIMTRTDDFANRSSTEKAELFDPQMCCIWWLILFEIFNHGRDISFFAFRWPLVKLWNFPWFDSLISFNVMILSIFLRVTAINSKNVLFSMKLNWRRLLNEKNKASTQILL